MKKLLALILSVTTLISLCGCGYGGVTPFDEDVLNGDYDFADDLDEIEDSVQIADDLDFQSGYVSSNIYYSDFAEIMISPLNSNWQFAGEQELLEYMDISVDDDEIFFDEEKKREEIEKQNTIYDAMLTDSSTGSNILILFENLENTNATSLTDEEYIDAIKTQLTQNGDYTIDDIYETEFADEEYTCMNISTVTNGVSLKQRQYIRRIGNYMIDICFTVGDGVTFDAIESMVEEY